MKKSDYSFWKKLRIIFNDIFGRKSIYCLMIGILFFVTLLKKGGEGGDFLFAFIMMILGAVGLAEKWDDTDYFKEHENDYRLPGFIVVANLILLVVWIGMFVWILLY